MFVAGFLIVSVTNTQNVNIPNTQFLYALFGEGVDIDNVGLISYEEAEAVTSLEVSYEEISYLTGIEAFIVIIIVREKLILEKGRVLSSAERLVINHRIPKFSPYFIYVLIQKI